MSVYSQQPSMTYSPNAGQNGHMTSIFPPSAQRAPPRKPPVAHLGQEILTQQDRYRDHGSFSSASTASSRPSGRFSERAVDKNAHHKWVRQGRDEDVSLEDRRRTAGYNSEYYRGSQSETSQSYEAHLQTYTEHDDSEQPADHAIWILIWLSLLDPLYCLVAALYTSIFLIPLFILTPLRFCRSNCDISATIVRFVSPLLRKHLRILCSTTLKRHPDVQYRPAVLILLYPLAPLLSIVVAIAAWVSALFWIFAIILGNPDGTERRDDGRATVLGVRNRWERYLLSAVRR